MGEAKVAVNHRWTPEEDSVIRCEYEHTYKSRRSIASKLRRPEAAIAYRIAVLGLGQLRRIWSDADVRKLIELLPNNTMDEVCRKLGRPRTSVLIKCKELSLGRRDRDGWFTEQEVCEILGVNHRWLKVRIASGCLIASPHDSQAMPRKGKSGVWHISEKDLRDFIRRYPSELRGHNIDVVYFVDILCGVTPPVMRGEE